MNVTVAIVTEAVNEVSGAGDTSLIETAREAHRVIKSQVVGALAGNTVHTDLNALGAEGVEFSQCYMTAQTRDAGDGKLTTEQVLDVIAQPKGI